MRGRRFLAVVGVFAVAVMLSGCPESAKHDYRVKAGKPPQAAPDTDGAAKPASEEHSGRGVTVPDKMGGRDARAPKDEPAPKKEPSEEKEKLAKDVEEAAEKPRDLGPPLVERPEELIRLHPRQAVWVDKKNKHVVIQGEVCQPDVLLEFFATYSTKSYEAVVAVSVTPHIVHAGLVAVGAEPGHPARFQPEYVPSTGTPVAIEVRWKDAQGKLQSCPAQNWIRDIKTKQAMDPNLNWVFAGSISETDKAGNMISYQADGGDIICMLSLPTAMLDLPVLAYGRGIESRAYEAFKERLPPPGTPVTLLLKPILTAKPAVAPPEKEVIDPRRAAAEQKAVEAAEAWLALADRAEYAQCRESAASFLIDRVERREFIKKVSNARKPLGKVVSRQLESKNYTTTLPKAPLGQYVVLKYKTSFENRKTAVETVTPMLDKDKKWRVSGYWIR
jgi:hypothetical protein